MLLLSLLLRTAASYIAAAATAAAAAAAAAWLCAARSVSRTCECRTCANQYDVEARDESECARMCGAIIIIVAWWATSTATSLG